MDIICSEQIYFNVKCVAVMIVVLCYYAGARLSTIALWLVRNRSGTCFPTYRPSKPFSVQQRVEQAALP